MKRSQRHDAKEHIVPVGFRPRRPNGPRPGIAARLKWQAGRSDPGKWKEEIAREGEERREEEENNERP